MFEISREDLDRVAGGDDGAAFSAVAMRPGANPAAIEAQVSVPALGAARTGDLVGAMREVADFAFGLPGQAVGAIGDVVDGVGDIANGLIPFVDPF